MKCYELKDCCFNGSNPQESRCPPHRLQIGCWEFDWVGFYEAVPDCEEKYEWRDIMLSKCPQCIVYDQHKMEMDSILEGLKNHL